MQQTRSLYAGGVSLDAGAKRRKRVAVVGGGISGLSCAWALDPHHEVVLFERDDRLGGHSHTLEIPTSVAPHLAAAPAPIPVDTGFIVYNEPAYPNLTALFAAIGVETVATDMSFAVSLDQGRLEYGTNDLRGLFAQRRNLARPRFWRMLYQLQRFYRIARSSLDTIDPAISLGDWLATLGHTEVLCHDHLVPMAAAIWSCPERRVLDHPARAFLTFCDNHGLLQVSGRPIWRTVKGGSRCYVERLRASLGSPPQVGRAITAVRPLAGGSGDGWGDGRGEGRGEGVLLDDETGATWRFDEVVLACHAPDALALLPDAAPSLRSTLAQFGVTRNRAVLHTDETLMPRRRAAWSSWNLLGQRELGQRALGQDEKAGRETPPCVTYWMNRLQALPITADILLTLNPSHEPAPDRVIHEQDYAHPRFDAASLAAQARLWSMQGMDRLWFAGAWLGAGFHEDGLQSGLAVAEALGGVRRPWSVAHENGRMPGPLTGRQPMTAIAA